MTIRPSASDRSTSVFSVSPAAIASDLGIRTARLLPHLRTRALIQRPHNDDKGSRPYHAAIDLDPAAVGHRVDAGAALDPADAESGRPQQRIRARAAQVIGIVLDGAQQPAHAVDGIDALLRRGAVAGAAARLHVPARD